MKSIIEVIEDEGIEMVDKGAYFQGKCPLHGDSQPSLVVYKNSNTFHCFGCGGHGDPIDFIKQYKKISFTEAVKYLNIPHNKSNVLLKYPSLIEKLAAKERRGVPVREKYKNLLIAMGWMVKEE